MLHTSVLPLFIFFVFFGSFAQAEEAQSDLMITAGDSISAGFNANTNVISSAAKVSPDLGISNQTLFPTLPNFASPFPRHNVPEWKLKLAQLMNHKEEYSWSSGDDIQSHFKKLKAYLALHEPNTKLTVANVAVSGAQAIDLAGEADQILKLWDSHEYRSIRYLTLLIGTNDACIDWIAGGVPNPEFIQSIKNFFAKLSVIKQSQSIRVLVSSLPRVPDLAQPEIFRYQLSTKKTCKQEAMDVVKYCNPLLDWTDASSYMRRVNIIASKNQAIQDAITEVSSRYPQFDIAYSKSLFESPVNLQSLANDCFHPNAMGQQSISEILWKDQPWFQ